MCFPPIFHWVPLLLGCLVLTFAGKAGGHPQVVLVDDINAEASKFKMPRTSLAFWILLTCDDIDQQSLRLHIKIHPSLFCRLYSGVGYGRIWTSSCNNWRGTSVAESLLPESHVKSGCWTCFHMTAPWLLKRGMWKSWTHVSQLKTQILWHTLSRFRLILPHLVQYVRESAPDLRSLMLRIVMYCVYLLGIVRRGLQIADLWYVPVTLSQRMV